MVSEIREKNLETVILYFPDFFVQDDQGWQGRGSLALCENVRLPVEAGRGQVSTYPLLLVPDRKLGHGFYGIPAGGHLPKPLHELLPNSWKLVPCQLQMANKHFFPKIRIHLPPQSSSSCTKNLESIKCQFLNYLLLFLTQYSNKDY